jgi:hypothetical protein
MILRIAHKKALCQIILIKDDLIERVVGSRTSKPILHVKFFQYPSSAIQCKKSVPDLDKEQDCQAHHEKAEGQVWLPKTK